MEVHLGLAPQSTVTAHLGFHDLRAGVLMEMQPCLASESTVRSHLGLHDLCAGVLDAGHERLGLVVGEDQSWLSLAEQRQDGRACRAQRGEGEGEAALSGGLCDPHHCPAVVAVACWVTQTTALLWWQRCQVGWATQTTALRGSSAVRWAVQPKQQPAVAAAPAQVCCMETCAASSI